MSRTSVRHEICPPSAYRDAIRILHARVDETWRDSVVDETYERVTAGEIDLSGLWVAYRRGEMRAVFLTHTLPGRTAAVWPPESTAVIGRAALVVGLIEHVLERLREDGVRLVQALLDPRDTEQRPGEELTAGGIPRVSFLTYMERSTEDDLSVPAGVPELEWRGYSEATDAEFRRVLDQTYEGSLDMPELIDVRSLDDMIAGRRGTPRFDPTYWQLGVVPGEPEAAAVMILSELPEKPAWEIAYFGLSPAARGRGIGRACLARAIRITRRFASRIELAVDERNIPAERLYRSAGFTSYDRRAVHLRLL